jgi:hypothetical protein
MVLKDMVKPSKGGKGFSGCGKMLPGWEKGVLMDRERTFQRRTGWINVKILEKRTGFPGGGDSVYRLE